MNNRSAGKQLARAAVIGALYAICTIIFAPISYGAVQFRISECLCVLAFFYPEGVVGLTVGCLIANLFGNGPLDVVLGTMATLIASLCSYLCAKRIKGNMLRFAVCSVFPIAVNALIVPFTILFVTDVPGGYWLLALQIAVGQAVVICTLGLLLYGAIIKRQKNGLNGF